MKVSTKIFLPVWLGTLIFFSACESSDSSKSEDSLAVTSDAGSLEVMQSKINQALAQKSSWQSHWAASVGLFDSSDFELVMTDSIDPMEMPEKNPILAEDPLFPYQLPHPEGNGTLDIYSYKVEAQESLDQPFLNPDSEVIWYRADGMKERLLFMGPSGMFEEALWMNASELMVLGFFQEEDGFRPMIWIINVQNHSLNQFRMTKVVKEYQHDSYLDTKLKTVDLT
ncbi:bifunctional isocitrate dehydrogenase kinase/phosphatase [Algoriphagus litoralis]|uniref:bifunctional isocitrate dehydrogenase kinase/phosphatase n=1 Tax=Algoriphagus litoralis TaxID=2202829 RepID=UPI000DBA1512|nr:bifunctional isocitrate dehydrogenase kinase/phosphatase [Algoriphagus litoralis]